MNTASADRPCVRNHLPALRKIKANHWQCIHTRLARLTYACLQRMSKEWRFGWPYQNTSFSNEPSMPWGAQALISLGGYTRTQPSKPASILQPEHKYPWSTTIHAMHAGRTQLHVCWLNETNECWMYVFLFTETAGMHIHPLVRRHNLNTKLHVYKHIYICTYI